MVSMYCMWLVWCGSETLWPIEMLFVLINCIIQKRPSDPDALRLLGEVKYELKDYEGSAAAYKNSERVSISQIFRMPCPVDDSCFRWLSKPKHVLHESNRCLRLLTLMFCVAFQMHYLLPRNQRRFVLAYCRNFSVPLSHCFNIRSVCAKNYSAMSFNFSSFFVIFYFIISNHSIIIKTSENYKMFVKKNRFLKYNTFFRNWG